MVIEWSVSLKSFHSRMGKGTCCCRKMKLFYLCFFRPITRTNKLLIVMFINIFVILLATLLCHGLHSDDYSGLLNIPYKNLLCIDGMDSNGPFDVGNHRISGFMIFY